MISIVKLTIVQIIDYIYNCHITELMFARKECTTMNKKQELIERIEKLTDEQFEMLISLFAQQEQESVQVDQSDRQTFLQSCG